MRTIFLRPVAFSALAMTLGCCGGGSAGTQENETTLQAATPQTETAVEASEPKADPPPIELHLERDDAGDYIPVVRAMKDARLAPEIAVERLDEAGWVPVEVELSLRYDCQSQAPTCVELVAGAELRPPAWRGELGHGQCECERCVPAPEGTYRVVVVGCEGGRVESPGVELGASPVFKGPTER